MFGYVKPYVPDLRVRENEMYRALYCGLCRSMGKCTGCLSRFTLSYDFVFLAALRTALCKDEIKVRAHRCFVHPLKKRPAVESSDALKYSAACSAVLCRAKLADDVHDARGVRRLSARLLIPAAARMEKRALRFGAERDAVYSSLEELSRLEAEGCPSVDTVADTFGELLGAVFSHGLSGNEEKIAAAVGRGVGKYIYVADAIEDREADAKSGNYNPLNISPAADDALRAAVRLELADAAAAAELADYSSVPEIGEIIRNILYEGLPRRIDEIIDKCKKVRHKTE